MTSFDKHSKAMAASTDYSFYLYHGMPTQDYSPVYGNHALSLNSALLTQNISHGYPQNMMYHPHSPAHTPTHPCANPFDLHPQLLSSTSDSGASMHSNISSAVGSPSLSIHNHSDWSQIPGVVPSIAHPENFNPDMFASSGFDCEPMMGPKHPNFVDPSLIQPISPSFSSAHCSEILNMNMNTHSSLFVQEPPSPAPSNISNHSNGRLSCGPMRSKHTTSPYQWNPYKVQAPTRPPSASSVESHQSQQSRNSGVSLDSVGEGKGICPIPTCGRHIKDLKAHLLTHKNERPEKCPISSCEYHTKGFARKYDKNRHTLTHYKGTMVCGFCPGSGSPAEKSFNRADVFKRHLTSVHGVEQTAPNSRRKSPGRGNKAAFGSQRETPGACSTCGVIFPNAQDFYDHLDDCVLRVVQQGNPSEAINERILTSMTDDKAVQKTMERHMLSTSLDLSAPKSFDQEDEEDDDDNNENYNNEDIFRTKENSNQYDEQSIRANCNTRQGLTHSKGGITAITTTSNSQKRRKNYPPSWGMAADQMRMKKRVLCVFDGPRRLCKDEMMLNVNHEALVTTIPLQNLGGGDGAQRWITDLDVQTLRRAEGFHGATEEEKGPWVDEEGQLINDPCY